MDFNDVLDCAKSELTSLDEHLIDILDISSFGKYD